MPACKMVLVILSAKVSDHDQCIVYYTIYNIKMRVRQTVGINNKNPRFLGENMSIALHKVATISTHMKLKGYNCPSSINISHINR